MNNIIKDLKSFGEFYAYIHRTGDNEQCYSDVITEHYIYMNKLNVEQLTANIYSSG